MNQCAESFLAFDRLPLLVNLSHVLRQIVANRVEYSFADNQLLIAMAWVIH